MFLAVVHSTRHHRSHESSIRTRDFPQSRQVTQTSQDRLLLDGPFGALTPCCSVEDEGEAERTRRLSRAFCQNYVPTRAHSASSSARALSSSALGIETRRGYRGRNRSSASSTLAAAARRANHL